MMDCEKSLCQISACLDGALSEMEQSELDAHLAQCPVCRTLWEEFSALHHTCCNLPELSAPEGFADGVQTRIRQEETKRRIPFRHWKRTVWGAVAACTIFCVGIANRDLMLDKDEFVMDDSLSDVVTGEAPKESERALLGSIEPNVSVQTQIEAMEDGIVPESVEEQMTVSSSSAGAGFQDVAVLMLTHLPQGSELWLEDGQVWEIEGETMVCLIDAECAYGLMKLAEEQGLILACTETREELWEPNIWKLVVVA